MADAVPRPLLSVEDLSVSYGQFRALSRVSLSVREGEIVAVIGANGAGKSSLMKAIVGQAGRVEGRIRFQGRDVAGVPTSRIVASGIALVPEGRRLFPSLTVQENLAIGCYLGRRRGAALDEVFDLFPPLAERRRQPAWQLSGGEQQMVALGRALLAAPRLLLCDEIGLGLAPAIIERLYALLPSLAARHIGILLVEQDVTRALGATNRFYCLLQGKVVLSGRAGSADHEVVLKQYLGS
jgi:branched-chain amino acid transport system ATP-binding protein